MVFCLTLCVKLPLTNNPHQPNLMKLLLALLAGLALAAYILALADGPSLVDIINKY